VGYTNAGKSTLFNQMTRAEVLAKDMLFATLDPTARVVKLLSGLDVILSDTVGFISDLPTTLIAAFRATLEDVIQADVILHVRDMAHPDAEAQGEDVVGILGEIGVNIGDPRRIIEVWNKADQLDDARRLHLANAADAATEAEQPVLVSALTGEGLDRLNAVITQRLSLDRKRFKLTVKAADGEGLSWLYSIGEVLSRKTGRTGNTAVVLRVGPEKEGLLLKRFPEAEVQ
jgi:GTPase